ncbi:MAG: hypothetical protein M1429_02240 [Patescibacteria group bacterium]|nr:hypothetical protein [Patescibacteria group bacterium]
MTETEFTSQEGELLGRLFPNGLATKLVIVIRDAILAAPKFAEKVQEITSLTICTVLGIEKLSDLRLKLESAGNDIPASVSRELEARLRDPSFVISLAEMLASNEAACTRLGNAINECREKQLGEAEIRRLDNLTGTVTNFYFERDSDPNKTILSKEAVKPLVNRLNKEMVVKGLKASQYSSAIAKTIPEWETQMTELIVGLCKARTNKQLIESTAVLLVLEGLPLETKVVRARLEREEDIASFLKRT